MDSYGPHLDWMHQAWAEGLLPIIVPSDDGIQYGLVELTSKHAPYFAHPFNAGVRAAYALACTAKLRRRLKA